ncbi:MAG: hypothetical protein ACREID_00270, partial [Planctomycetota bacterium]
LDRAEGELTEMGRISRKELEIKRIYGLGAACRQLALHYQHRSQARRSERRVKEAQSDDAKARDYATKGLERFEKILSGDDELSRSLHLEAHAGAANCQIVLGDADHTESFREAVKHIGEFARLSATARKFWEQRRERLMTADPLPETDADPGKRVLTEPERRRYDEQLRRLLSRETAMRRILVETYVYLNLFRQAIEECDTIEKLDPSVDEILLIRGRAFAMLEPPDYQAALANLHRYRSRQDLGSLTEKMIRLNRLIKTYEERLKAQGKEG